MIYQFPELAKINNLALAEPIDKIEALECYLKSRFETDFSQFPLHHFVNNGKYVREIFLPKGSLIISKIHNFDHISILSQGDVTIYDVTGKIERIKAPWTWLAPKGMKRLIYVHEDTVWNTVHTVPDGLQNEDELTNYIAHDSDLTRFQHLIGVV